MQSQGWLAKGETEDYSKRRRETVTYLASQEAKKRMSDTPQHIRELLKQQIGWLIWVYIAPIVNGLAVGQ